jgi:hypothetical protein
MFFSAMLLLLLYVAKFGGTTSVYVRGEDERRVDKNAILFVVAPMEKVSTCPPTLQIYFDPNN